MGLMSMKFNKRFAFTLSEVMITLTLIGFIATMTLSTIGSSVQQRARLAEFKTAYAKMEATLRNITVEENKIYKCYECPTTAETKIYGLSMKGGCTATGNQCQSLQDSFVRAMGATRFCENNPITEGCLPANYPAAPGGGCFQDFTKSDAFVLDNSMILITDGNKSLKQFAVDVNGRKGPNKWGQDIFTFAIKANNSNIYNGRSSITNIGIYPPTTCLPKSTGASKSSDEMLKEAINYNG